MSFVEVTSFGSAGKNCWLHIYAAFTGSFLTNKWKYAVVMIPSCKSTLLLSLLLLSLPSSSSEFERLSSNISTSDWSTTLEDLWKCSSAKRMGCSIDVVWCCWRRVLRPCIASSVLFVIPIVKYPNGWSAFKISLKNIYTIDECYNLSLNSKVWVGHIIEIRIHSRNDFPCLSWFTSLKWHSLSTYQWHSFSKKQAEDNDMMFGSQIQLVVGVAYILSHLCGVHAVAAAGDAVQTLNG